MRHQNRFLQLIKQAFIASVIRCLAVPCPRTIPNKRKYTVLFFDVQANSPFSFAKSFVYFHTSIITRTSSQPSLYAVLVKGQRTQSYPYLHLRFFANVKIPSVIYGQHNVPNLLTSNIIDEFVHSLTNRGVGIQHNEAKQTTDVLTCCLHLKFILWTCS